MIPEAREVRLPAATPLPRTSKIGVEFFESCHRDVPKSKGKRAARVPPAGEHPKNQSDTWSAHAVDCVAFFRVIKGHAMKLPRRQFLHLAAGAAALPAVSRIARAQTYPARPVRIIVGFSAGGVADISAPLMGQWLSERRWRP
jgi:hypothetical protein